MRLGIIGGTGLTRYAGDAVVVETRHGSVPVTVERGDEVTTFFVPRHGAGHVVPPHRVDHRANVAALAACRVDRVVAVNAVGALTEDVPVPSLVVVDDILDLTGRAATFWDEHAVHVDLSAPYCPKVRRALLEAAEGGKLAVVDGGVYAAVAGPRLETPAEVRFLAERASVVGMTGMPEAGLAREAGLCYASLSVVTNPAATEDGALTATGIREAFRGVAHAVREVLTRVPSHLAATGGCTCRHALQDAFLREETLPGGRGRGPNPASKLT